MVTTKHCAFGKCNSDSRYSDRPSMKDVFFVRFPSPKYDLERCKKWVAACRRLHFTVDKVTKDTYICSKHFVGSNGPTELSPDPIPATATLSPSKIHIRQSIKRQNSERSLNRKKVKVNSENEAPLAQNDVLSSSVCSAFSGENLLCNKNATKSCHTEEEYEIAEALTLLWDSKPEGTQPNESAFSSPYYAPNVMKTVEIGIQCCLMQENATAPGDAEGDSAKLSWFCNDTELGKLNWAIHREKDCIKFLNVWKGMSIIQSISLFPDGHLVCSVLGKQVDMHSVLQLKQDRICSPEDLEIFFRDYTRWQVCMGIYNQQQINTFNSMKSTKAFLCPYMHTVRVTSCSLLIQKGKTCPSCRKYTKCLEKVMQRNKVVPSCSTLSKRTMKSRLEKRRQIIRSLKCKTKRLQIRLHKLVNKDTNPVISSQDHAIAEKIAKEQVKTLRKNSFLSFFIQEQLKASKCKSSHGHRWHPLILKWCMYINNKSSTTYRALKSSGFIVSLKISKRTLYRNANVGTPPGITDASIEDLVKSAELDKAEEHQTYISIIHDEMYIRSDLVYEKRTGELIGFATFNDVGNELWQLEKEINSDGKESEVTDDLATSILALFARGLTTNLKQSFAYYPVTKLSVDKLSFILWEAVEKLESVGFKVLGIVSDGAGVNRKFCRLHSYPSLEFPYKTENVFAGNETRDIYFIPDAPHLLKTVRNCFSNSNFHLKSRRLWKSGKEILWTHVLQVYEMEAGKQFKKNFKLSYEHVHLTSFSRMRVKLAAQVLSATVAASMKNLLGNDASETVIFIEMMNKWFDIMNTRNQKEAFMKRNNNLQAFKKDDDDRLKWLTDEFLVYLKNWKKEVEDRKGFSPLEKKKMFISEETYEGLGMSVHSCVEMIQFLIRKGAKFVLTSHMNQDPLELEFGLQRAAGGCSENPSVKEYKQNNRKIKDIRKHILQQRGNVSF